MKSIDIKAFRKVNNLTQSELGEYLGCTKAFISAIEKGNRPLPEEMYSKLVDSDCGWDLSLIISPNISPSQNNPAEDALVDYLQRKVEDQESLIRELYQQIGVLEAKLDLARKGETVDIAVGSSVAHVG